MVSDSATAILTQLKYRDTVSRTTIDVQLPEDNFLVTVSPGSNVTRRARTCFYSVTGIEQLNRHATCLINILNTTSVSQMNSGKQIVSFNEHIPWLADSLEELNEEQKRWRHQSQYSPCLLLGLTIDLVRSSSTLNDLVLQKLYTIMVLISADVAEHPGELAGPAQNAKSAINILALSLAHLSSAVIRKRPIAKLVAAKLLKPLEHLSVGLDNFRDANDLTVRCSSAHVLLRF